MTGMNTTTTTTLDPDKPDSPLFVACSTGDGKQPKKILFRTAQTVSLGLLKERISQTFSLSSSSYHLTYHDEEEGEDCPLQTEDDLTDAIYYFLSGPDENTTQTQSRASTEPGSHRQYPNHHHHSILNVRKKGGIHLVLKVVLEYDGPSLSDTSSLHEGSFVSSTLEEEEGEGGYETGSGYTWEERSRLSYTSGVSGASGASGAAGSGRSGSSAYRMTGQGSFTSTNPSSTPFPTHPGARRSIIAEESEREAHPFDLHARRGGRDGGYDRSNSFRSFENRSDRSLEHRGGGEGRYDTPQQAEGGYEWDRDRGKWRGNGYDPYSGGRGDRDRDHQRYDPHPYSHQHPHPYSYPNQPSIPPPQSSPHPLPYPIPTSTPTPTTSTSASIASELKQRWLTEQTIRTLRKLSSSSSSAGSAAGAGAGAMKGTHFHLQALGGRSGSGRVRGSGRGGNGRNGYVDVDGEGEGDEFSEAERGSEDGSGTGEGEGVLELMRDGRGKWYYSYSSSHETLPPLQSTASSSASSLHRTLTTPSLLTEHEDQAIAYDLQDPTDSPSLAPDCSVCGDRLGLMRYVCTLCGPGRMWSAGSSTAEERRRESDSVSSGTVTTRPPGEGEGEGEEEEEGERIQEEIAEAVASPLGSPSENGSHGGRSFDQIVSPLENTSISLARGLHPLPDPKGGYELCPGCIEEHGIRHTRAMGEARDLGDERRGGKIRRFGRLNHTYREMIWSATGWQEIQYHDECNCSICNVQLYEGRFRCVTCTNFNLCRSCHSNALEIHPAHAFLAVPDQKRRSVPVIETTPVNPEISLTKHPNVFCHNCLQDIIGPRFHCAVCPAWDLCTQCQGVTAAVTGTGSHTADHIMLKIPLPLPSNEVRNVSLRARERWAQEDSTVAAAAGEILAGNSRSPSPTNDTVYGGPAPRSRPRLTATIRDSLDHGMVCRGCDARIIGQRYQCANCPSDPDPYSLCAACEQVSHLKHDATHVFFRFDRPVHHPLQSPGPLLPLMYRQRVGQVRGQVDPADPTSYLKHVTHHSTLCDIHVGPIQGAWLRCAHCVTNCDVCTDCATIVEHDPKHVFAVFKSEVDMPTFRTLTMLSETHSRPLINQAVYN